MFKKTACAALLTVSAAMAQANIIEGFDNVSDLASKGFILRNTSSPAGVNSFFQGNTQVFSAPFGSANSYLGASYESARAGGTVDDWLISPEFSTTAGGTISFYLRAADESGFSDTFSFGMSTGSTAAADFALGALTIAPRDAWTRFTFTFDATQTPASVGRFAIRYAGPADALNYVGIDSLAIDLPEPASLMLIGLGLVGLVTTRRKAR